MTTRIPLKSKTTKRIGRKTTPHVEPRAFTYYWKKNFNGVEGDRIGFAAGNVFTKSRLKRGDRVFIVSRINGHPHLLGAMTITGFCFDPDRMEDEFGWSRWDAKEFIIDAKGGTKMTFKRPIPDAVAGEIRFETAHGPEAMKYAPDGTLDRQTLRNVRRLTPESARLLEELLKPRKKAAASAASTSLVASDTEEPPERFTVTTTRVVRDTAAAQELKRLYGYICQVCGNTICIAETTQYAEVHHVRPLGSEHGGLDRRENMLVLCPNHHAQFDYGYPEFLTATSVRIGASTWNLTMKPGHMLDPKNWRYHNELRKSKK